jgi:hypothetical protein
MHMPAFPMHAEFLVAGLAAEHGMPAQIPDEQRPIDEETAAIGERLTQQAPAGFFCTECHAVGDRPPAGAFEHKGVNFALVTRRIHREYYLRWITDPVRLDLGSKMPKFSPDGKTTIIKSAFDGDAQRQFEAMWEYLRSIAKLEGGKQEGG